jgi:hypothetical protein
MAAPDAGISNTSSSGAVSVSPSGQPHGPPSPRPLAFLAQPQLDVTGSTVPATSGWCSWCAVNVILLIPDTPCRSGGVMPAFSSSATGSYNRGFLLLRALAPRG